MGEMLNDFEGCWRLTLEIDMQRGLAVWWLRERDLKEIKWKEGRRGSHGLLRKKQRWEEGEEGAATGCHKKGDGGKGQLVAAKKKKGEGAA